MAKETIRACRLCGEAEYEEIPLRNTADIHNSGLGVRPVGMGWWRALECPKCGNVQVFRAERPESR